MARLPAPIVDSMPVAWPRDYKEKEATIYSVLGQLMRTKRVKDKIKEKRKEDEEKEERVRI